MLSKELGHSSVTELNMWEVLGSITGTKKKKKHNYASFLGPWPSFFPGAIGWVPTCT
jgi:hypothetical protein